MARRRTCSAIAAAASLFASRACLCVSTAFLFTSTASIAFVYGQSGPTTESASGDEVDAATVKFHAELDRLAAVCDSIGLEAQAAFTRRWKIPTRTDQLALFLPAEKESDPATPNARRWLKHFAAARESYADALFAAAKNIVARDETEAYRLLWRTLRENPEHAGARTVLSALVGSATANPRLRKGTAALTDLGWTPRSYFSVNSRHFNLVSNADTESTKQLAAQLEQTFVLWTQVFYAAWAEPGKLSEGLTGDTLRAINFPRNRDKFRVVLLKDRESYLKLLGASEEAVGASVGYYWPAGKQSIFYAGEELQLTLTHELTHQFFAESARQLNAKGAAVGESGDYWIVEGIAMYMESLTRRDNHWTVGGWESARLQTARYRGVRDGFWIPMERLSGSTLEGWKADSRISLLYSHAAGLTHALMDNELRSATRAATIKAIGELYAGERVGESLLQQFGSDDAAAKDNYQDALIVSDADVSALAETDKQVDELVLVGSQLSAESWKTLTAQTQLTWLDVSYSNISAQALSDWLAGTTRLERLSVEGTQLSGAAAASARGLPALTELDLSDTPHSDAELASLAGHPTLEALWLTRTQITDAALSTIKTLPRLRFVDVTGTAATNAAWKQWSAP